MIELAAIALTFLLFSLFSRRLASTVITAPLFFMLAGFALASDLVQAVSFDSAFATVQVVAITALGLSFFTDASRISVSTLTGSLSLPARLLVIGLPLTFLLGALFAALIFPQMALVEAALLAIILSPSDTGLITTVLGSSRVPTLIRRTINIESSINDGLTTPIAAILIALSQSRLGYEEVSFQLLSPLTQIMTAVLVGGAVGAGGGYLMRLAEKREWIVPTFQGLLYPALVMLALSVTNFLNGNYFIACFIAGVLVGLFIKDYSRGHLGFAETLMQLLSLVTFMFLGTELLKLWGLVTWRVVLYALLSLTVVRILPAAIALWGKKLRWESVLFLGWFGPRGLASIVLATIVVGSIPDVPHVETIVIVAVVTVSLSVLLHGISTIPLVVWYGRRVERMPPDAREFQQVDEIPARFGWLHSAERAEARISGWEERRLPREPDEE